MAGKRKVIFKDTDRGLKKIQREIAKAKKKPHVQVGIYGGEATADHGGVPNIKVAATHEYGLVLDHPGGTAYFLDNDGRAHFVSNEKATPDMPRTQPHKIPVPERSFIRATVDLYSKKIGALAKGLQSKVFAGEMETKQALETLGLYVKGLIQSRISKGIGPPLKAATIRRKGSSKPLIDTGQLRASIDSKVNNAE